MNREPVNTDDPQMTAYALGELSIAESVEFEAKLKDSPLAARELAEMNAVMGLLTKGLAEEWENERENSAFEVVSSAETNVVVQGNFGPSKKTLFAAAAAVAMMAVVGSSFVNSGSGLADSSGSTTGKFAMSAASQDSVEPANTVDRGTVANVPQLFLAEEMDDIGGLRLATKEDSSIDATYIEAFTAVPASYQGGVERDVQNALLSRVDSYLPPVADDSLDAAKIENRLGERVISSEGDQSVGSPVFVRGFVSMDGSDSQFDSGGKTLVGFKPVSISGNPVQSGERDLRILSELSGVQRELERVVSEMPATEARRSELIQILNRNREAMSDLKREFSQ